MAGPLGLRKFAGDGPLNTDDRPLVMFRAPHFAGINAASPYGRLFELLEGQWADPAELMADEAGAAELMARLGAYVAGRDRYLRGLRAEIEGGPEAGVESFVASARASPDFTTGYAYGLALATQRSSSDPAGARRLLERLMAARPENPVAGQLLERLSRRP
ncbi:MAG: hypothetical protein FJ387_10350 [Verrucomicrobia bacterium]|nr:hypothetical protein [Verrucomicrobiota bacterium]